MSDQFPLTKSLGLDTYVWHESQRPIGATDVIIVEDLEALLEKGVRVYGYQDQKPAGWCSSEHYDNTTDYSPDTHSALLINIQPIVKDTAESLLREMASLMEPEGFVGEENGMALFDQKRLVDVFKRARKLLKP